MLGGGSHSQHLRVATLVHLGGCGWDSRPSDRTSIWSCSRGARTAQLAWRHCNGPCEGIAYTQLGACPHDRQRYYSCGTWGYFLAGKLTCSKLTVPFWAIAANLFGFPHTAGESGFLVMIQCRESEGAEGTFATLNQRTSQISMVILIRLLLGHPLGRRLPGTPPLRRRLRQGPCHQLSGLEVFLLLDVRANLCLIAAVCWAADWRLPSTELFVAPYMSGAALRGRMSLEAVVSSA